MQCCNPKTVIFVYLGNGSRYRLQTNTIGIVELQEGFMFDFPHYVMCKFFFVRLLWNGSSLGCILCEALYSLNAVHSMVSSLQYVLSFCSILVVVYLFVSLYGPHNLSILKLYISLIWQHWQINFCLSSFILYAQSFNAIKGYMFYLKNYKLVLGWQHCLCDTAAVFLVTCPPLVGISLPAYIFHFLPFQELFGVSLDNASPFQCPVYILSVAGKQRISALSDSHHAD